MLISVPSLLHHSQQAAAPILYAYVANLMERLDTWADQLGAVDRDRLIKLLGILPDYTLVEILIVMQAMFTV